MKQEKKTQRLMNTVNYKPDSESVRLTFEKTSRWKAFAGITASSYNLINAPCLQFDHNW